MWRLYTHVVRRDAGRATPAGYAVYSDPCGITKDDTDEVTMYDSIEDAYERAVLDGIPLKEIVANIDEDGEDSEICVCDDWDIKNPLLCDISVDPNVEHIAAVIVFKFSTITVIAYRHAEYNCYLISVFSVLGELSK